MSTHSTIPTVRQKLVDLLKARPDLAEVLIAYALPTWPEREAIYFSGATFRHDLPVMRANRKPRDEEYELRGYIVAAAPGNASDEADLRAFELLGVLEDVLADDPQLGFTDGTIAWSKLGQCDAGLDPEREGWDGLIQFRIEVMARLT